MTQQPEYKIEGDELLVVTHSLNPNYDSTKPSDRYAGNNKFCNHSGHITEAVKLIMKQEGINMTRLSVNLVHERTYLYTTAGKVIGVQIKNWASSKTERRRVKVTYRTVDDKRWAVISYSKLVDKVQDLNNISIEREAARDRTQALKNEQKATCEAFKEQYTMPVNTNIEPVYNSVEKKITSVRINTSVSADQLQQVLNLLEEINNVQK